MKSAKLLEDDIDAIVVDDRIGFVVVLSNPSSDVMLSVARVGNEIPKSIVEFVNESRTKDMIKENCVRKGKKKKKTNKEKLKEFFV